MLIARAIWTTVCYNFPVFKDLLAFIINGLFKSVSGEICNIFVVFINMIVNQISLTEKSDNGEYNPITVISLYLINAHSIIVHINFTLLY